MGGCFAVSIEAAASAADLFISNLMGQLSTWGYKLSQIRNAILPFHSIHRNRKVIIAIGNGRILRMFARLRQSELPKGEFVRFLKSILRQCDDRATLFPFCLSGRRSLISRFNLDSEVSLLGWSEALSALKSKLIESPADLVVFQPNDIRASDEDFRFLERALVLRRAIRINVDGDPRHAANARLSKQRVY